MLVFLERVPLDFDDIDRSTTVEKIVMTLRQAVFAGTLVPGERLQETALAQRLRIARGTLREAIQALIADGLLTKLPNRSVAVRTLTVAEVEDIYQSRLFLERASAHAAATCPVAAFLPVKQALKVYEAKVKGGDRAQVAHAHIEFHTAMVLLLGFQRVADLERSLIRDLQLVIASLDTCCDDLPKELERHRVLCKLCCDRKVEDLIQHLELDLDHAKALAIQHIERK